MTRNLMKEIILVKKGRKIEYRYISLDTAKIVFTEKNDYLKKYHDEMNQMNMSDDNKSDKRYQMSKIEEEKVTEDIEVLKLGKLISQKNIDNINKKLMKENGWI